MNDVIYKPRTGTELSRACPGTPIFLYGDLCDYVKENGIGRTLAELFSISPRCFILLQNPDNPKSGHWLALSIHPATREIFFFSSYGGKPDVEKNRWISRADRIRSHQDEDVLNDGLKDMAIRGWTVHYNDHPYQFEGDKTATCGIWSAAFLNSGMNPDEFFYYTNFHHLDALDYYEALFM